jgi:DnaJ-class molecular chaperone
VTDYDPSNAYQTCQMCKGAGKIRSNPVRIHYVRCPFCLGHGGWSKYWASKPRSNEPVSTTATLPEPAWYAEMMRGEVQPA